MGHAHAVLIKNNIPDYAIRVRISGAKENPIMGEKYDLEFKGHLRSDIKIRKTRLNA
jgi:hypothetical protein